MDLTLIEMGEIVVRIVWEIRNFKFGLRQTVLHMIIIYSGQVGKQLDT